MRKKIYNERERIPSTAQLPRSCLSCLNSTCYQPRLIHSVLLHTVTIQQCCRRALTPFADLAWHRASEASPWVPQDWPQSTALRPGTRSQTAWVVERGSTVPPGARATYFSPCPLPSSYLRQAWACADSLAWKDLFWFTALYLTLLFPNSKSCKNQWKKLTKIEESFDLFV